MPKLCNFQNCRERAVYGPKYNYPLTCKQHKGDMRLVSRICICGKAHPSYNDIGEIKALYCSSCKTDNMINIKDRKCKCGKIPVFNIVGEKIAICCVSCKTDTMVDVKNKLKCKCGKQSNYNNPGQKIPIYCASCKTDSMIDTFNKKCKCGKRPIFNKLGEINAVCCASCKTETMVNIKNKKCIGLIKNDIIYNCPYNTIGNKKYKNYCTECFRRNFPLDPLTFQIKSKTKEIAVRDFINASFEGFQHDKLLETSHCDCTIRRRIDHRKLIGNTLLVIETDENQHKSYDEMNEQTRYDDLFMAFSGKWIYIRFNPDKYKNKEGYQKNPMVSTRLDNLKIEIEKQIKRIECEENTDLIERIYMYYDGCD